MPIHIHSSDPDFADTLAEQLRLELGVECVQDRAQAALVVTTGDKPADFGGSVLVVGPPPLSMAALLAEIQAALSQAADADSLRLAGGLRLHVHRKQLALGHQVVDVTDKEIKLLQCLAKVAGQVVPREQLLKNVWGIESALDTHTLETHIYRLRGKFRELFGRELSGREGIAASEGGYRLEA